MNQTQAKRLLNVVLALRESPTPKKFNMGAYVHGEHYPTEETSDRNFCGTPACALGHYGARRDLQRFLKIEVVNAYPEKYAVLKFQQDGDPIDFSDERVQKHFGINGDEADDLFGPHGCNNARGAKQAARYIEKFVAKKMKAADRG